MKYEVYCTSKYNILFIILDVFTFFSVSCLSYLKCNLTPVNLMYFNLYLDP